MRQDRSRRGGRLSWLAATALVLCALTASTAVAQGQRGQDGRNLRGVLGGVPLTAADSAVQAVVMPRAVADRALPDEFPH